MGQKKNWYWLRTCEIYNCKIDLALYFKTGKIAHLQPCREQRWPDHRRWSLPKSSLAITWWEVFCRKRIQICMPSHRWSLSSKRARWTISSLQTCSGWSGTTEKPQSTRSHVSRQTTKCKISLFSTNSKIVTTYQRKLTQVVLLHQAKNKPNKTNNV